MKKYLIAPSILSADLARLGQEVDKVVTAGADLIHFDVMDQHYVPNLTFGPCVLKSLVKYGVKVPIDVHLMVSPVNDLIKAFIAAGAAQITFHPDATHDVLGSIKLIKAAGLKAGLALNPQVPLEAVINHLDIIDLILVMTVNPGFGGQQIIPAVYDKIGHLRHAVEITGRNITIAVDGGITPANVAVLAKLGATMFVAGNAIFAAPDYQAVINQFRKSLS